MELAKYIFEDLKRRIAARESIPEPLTLTELAAQYGVSLTPVRMAVQKLVEEGYLVKKPNRRLEIRSGRRIPRTQAHVLPPRKSADWDRELVQEVVHASLCPERVFLREERLAKKLGTGRSIIRQSLSRLAAAGLIEHVPHRGWQVHPIRQEDVCAYLTVREMLELKALELARFRLERERLEEFLAGNQMANGDTGPRLDNRLHSYIIEKSGNRYIQKFFRQSCAAYYSALFDYAAPEADVVSQMSGQHRAILEALLEQDWERASRALSEHIWTQQPILENLLASIAAARSAE